MPFSYVREFMVGNKNAYFQEKHAVSANETLKPMKCDTIKSKCLQLICLGTFHTEFSRFFRGKF